MTDQSRHAADDATSNEQDEKRGSCFFADHGVSVKTFTTTADGGTVLRTPGQALFGR